MKTLSIMSKAFSHNIGLRLDQLFGTMPYSKDSFFHLLDRMTRLRLYWTLLQSMTYSFHSSSSHSCIWTICMLLRFSSVPQILTLFSELLKYLLKGIVEILCASFPRPNLLWLQNDQSWSQNISIITFNVCNVLIVENIRCNVQGVKKNSTFVIVVKHPLFLSSMLEKKPFSRYWSTFSYKSL